MSVLQIQEELFSKDLNFAMSII